MPPSAKVVRTPPVGEPQWGGGPGDEVVVLTGSSGCLGHQTLKLLISHDDSVAEIRCLDLVEPSESMKRSIDAELAKLEAAANQREGLSKRVKYINGDIRDINTVEACLEGADCVIHCAAKVDIWVEPGEQDEKELESINVTGTENLLRACVQLGVPKFVHVSSFETFVSHHTIYYATECTLPEPKWRLFGSSGDTKKEAEMKVRQFSNNKLKQVKPGSSDSLNAVIIRFTPIYGPGDKYFVSKILKIAHFFNGKLQRFTNVWIRQQPIFVGNAAWSLIKAKKRMDVDDSISGEGR
jgi:dihydroflavonol-4-reductase